jgi:hypothetical protein
MSSDEFGRPDDPVDAPLRDAYRQLATERAPRHLDKAVLEQAAEATKTAARPRLWAWRRPLAWMTMIGLTVAVVLEFSQVPTDLAPASPTNAVSPVGADGDAIPTPAASKMEADKARRDRELETMSAPAGANLDQAEPRMPAAVVPDAPAPATPLEQAAGSSEKRLREATPRRPGTLACMHRASRRGGPRRRSRQGDSSLPRGLSRRTDACPRPLTSGHAPMPSPPSDGRIRHPVARNRSRPAFEHPTPGLNR